MAALPLLDALFAPLQEAVLLTDDPGAFVYISPNVEQIFGYTREELCRQGTIDLVFGGRVVEVEALRRTGGLSQIERTISDKAGTAHILRISAQAVRILTGTVLYSCTDITRRLEELQLLRASEARFRLMAENSLAENSYDILIYYRLKPDIRIEYMTPTVTHLIGYTPEAFYADQALAWSLVHPDDVPALQRKLQYPVESPQPLTVRVCRRDGALRWLQFHTAPIQDADGQMTAVVSVVRDVTAQQEAVLARERALAELQATLDSLADALVIYSPEGRVVRYNAAVAAIFGDALSAYLAHPGPQWFSQHARRPAGDAVPPEDFTGVRALRGEVVHGDVLVFPRPPGEDLWVSASAARIALPDGRIAGVVTTYTDVTVLHRLQQEREDLLRTISHDLRTPLAIIHGHAQELEAQAGVQATPDAQESVQAILRSVQRMHGMIQDLVDAARGDSRTLQLACTRVALAAFLDDLLARARPLEEVGRVRLAIPADLPPVWADSARLERIIMNLLSNALKYSAPDTPVTIRAARRGAEVVVAITDRGPGIPPDELPRIFDRFYRATGGRQAEGMGLGLYIAKLLVEAHGGRLWAESTVDQGSTFSFTLPLARDDAAGERAR